MRTSAAAGKSLALAVGLALTASLSVQASAEPQARPNGPWVQDAQHLSLEGFRDYEQLTAELHEVERASGGRMVLESAGESNEGRDIWLARVGAGDRVILYVTQQHGNEPHGTEAAVQFLRTLTSSDHPDVQRIRDELTVLVIPRVNPDGAERYWRQNVDPDCDGGEPSCLPGRGYDVNRWHDPRVPDEDVPVPETLAVRQVYAEHQPELVIDYHGQLSYVTNSGQAITTSVLWPMFPSEVDVTPERQAAADYGKQVSRLIYDSLQRYGHAEVTRYPSGTTMGTARNAYGYLGSASVLFEQRANAGQKSIGMLVRQAYVAMFDVAHAVADGSVSAVDPALADEIPPRGPAITNPNSGTKVERCSPEQSSARGTVVEDEGPLYDYVVAYEAERILPRGSEGYVRPTEEEACTLAAAFGQLVAGNPETAAGLADPLGYDVVRLADPSTGRTHLLLSERLAGETVERGWGLYVHSPDSASEVTVEAIYPQSATFSERLAAQAFDELDARNLFVAGAHRNANGADEFDTEPANPSRNADSAFHRIHTSTVAETGSATIQTLGASGGDREIVVTAGEAPPTDFAGTLAGGLVDHGYDVCLYGDGSCTRLPSTTNLQGQVSRAVGADWVALYPSFGIRRLLSNRQELAEGLANILATGE